MPSPPNLRQIAAAAKVSISTVSLALRDSPRLSAATRARVKAAAESLGHRPNPLVAAYQASVRTSRPLAYKATLAWIDCTGHGASWEATGPRQLNAALARANELGYGLERVRIEDFDPDQPGRMTARFLRVLKARGMMGVLLPPLGLSSLAAEDWGHYPVVIVGHIYQRLHETAVKRRAETPFDVVASHTPYNVELSIHNLRARGRTRIGLVAIAWFDDHADRAFTATALAHNLRLRAADRVPPLLLDRLYVPRSKKQFMAWYEKHRPDAILALNLEVLDWCRALGLRIPQDVAVAHLHRGERDDHFSGIDPLVDIQAQVAIDLLTSKIIRNEQGPPDHPIQMLVPGEWRDADTA